MNAAWSLAVDLAFALHPKVWRWGQPGVEREQIAADAKARRR